jgi:NTP pyrophosphatase (non-canonical NTP hydrolase)
MYYLYHIPGKKIGVTRNLYNRVTKQQGYNSKEYEVLFSTEDISKISSMEIELQKSYGYKVDRQTYKNLIQSNLMKVNVTEQTTTFPIPLNKLKDRLEDAIGLKWDTPFGSFEITKENYKELFKNCYTSMFNRQRSFVYNKILEALELGESVQENNKEEEDNTVFDNIREWARTRGIYNSGDSKTQYLKLTEEVGELAQGILKQDRAEIKDAIGDIVVVLTNLANMEQMNIEECIHSAYDEIKNREGSMQNGTFVKNYSPIKKPFGHQSATL